MSPPEARPASIRGSATLGMSANQNLNTNPREPRVKSRSPGSVLQLDIEDFQGVEGPKIANIAPNAKSRPEEHHHTATDVPRHFVVEPMSVNASPFETDHSDANQAIGANAEAFLAANGMPSIRLPVAESTPLPPRSVLPKKSELYPKSPSRPMTPAPIHAKLAPQLNRLASAESPNSVHRRRRS